MKWGALRALRWAGASMVFQGALHSLNPVQRVGAQIAEPIPLHEPDLSDPRRSTTRVGELLEQVGLPRQRARAYPHQLSGGQRQRVMIAMALACRPRLIVADEPTTALDVMVQAQVLNVLQGLVSDLDVGLLMISHDLSVLADLCDRIAVMYAGRVVEHGPADKVFTDPLHPYAGALSASFPRIGDVAARYAPAGLPGDPPDPAELPSGCSFHPRCPKRFDDCDTVVPELRSDGGEPGRGLPAGGAPMSETARPRSRPAASASASRAAAARSRGRWTASTSASRRGRSSRWWASRAPARPRSPAPCWAWRSPPPARCCSTGSPSSARRGGCGPSGGASSSCSRTRPARSTPGTRSTSRSPRASGCTGSRAPTARVGARRSSSRRRCPRPGCGPRSGCSCATRTSSPAVSGSAC